MEGSLDGGNSWGGRKEGERSRQCAESAHLRRPGVFNMWQKSAVGRPDNRKLQHRAAEPTIELFIQAAGQRLD